MDPVSLDTTNTWLAIMAIVAILDAVLLVGMGVGGFVVYRRVMRVVGELEARQVAPLREKVDAILVDVKTITARVSEQTARVDSAIAGTMGRVDDTAERMKDTVRDRVSQATGIIHALRAVLVTLFSNEPRKEPPAEAAGRV